MDLLEQTLSADLGRLENWLRLNQLHMNVDKPQVLLLARKGLVHQLNNFSVSANGQEVTTSDSVQFLGVIVDSRLTWVDHMALI